MSLLRICQQAPKSALARSLVASSRFASSEAKLPAETSEQSSAEIVSTPTRDAVPADVISGAPGAFRMYMVWKRYVCSHIVIMQLNCDIGLFGFSSLLAAQLRAELASLPVGGLIGTSCKVPVDGRIPSWDGPARMSHSYVDSVHRSYLVQCRLHARNTHVF